MDLTIPIICGTFTSSYIYILTFSTISRQLEIHKRIQANGPHQYLAFRDLSSDQRGEYQSESKSVVEISGQVYATSWQVPPRLWSWTLTRGGGGEGGSLIPRWDLKESGSVPITAVSSYITLHNDHIYSVGGPTGESHALPESTQHGFGEKVQEMVYVPKEQLAGWDKTREALRYGAHGIEFDTYGRAYVPDLGSNAIWVHYPSSSGKGSLDEPIKHVSPREADGPRHAVVSKDGKNLYAVTQFVDVYEISAPDASHGSPLRYLHSSSLIPQEDDPHQYRGDTIRLSSKSLFVFATTRGAKPSTKGYLCAYELDEHGRLAHPDEDPSAVFQTPTSGGKANAIEIFPDPASNTKEWLVLTDSEQGLVLVIEFDPERRSLTEVSRVNLEEGDGASHAIWVPSAAVSTQNDSVHAHDEL